MALDGAAPKSDDKPDLAKKQKRFRAYETNKRDEQNEARIGRKYYHDKQWSDDEKAKLRARGQADTTRNRIKRKVDFLVGVEQRLRRDPKAYPRTPQHEADADTATAALRFVCDQNQWGKLTADCMHDGLVSGIGVIFLGIEGQDPKMRTCAVDRFFYDPRSVEPDFSDAQYMGLHLWLDIEDAKAKWPDKERELSDMMDNSSSNASSTALEQDRDQQWADFENDRVRVVEMWERKHLGTGSQSQMMNSTAQTPAAQLATHGWYFCFFTGDVVLEAGWSPYKGLQDEPDCPYEAWSPYIDEKGTRYGLVRTLKSIQDEVNYSCSKMLHRLSTRQFFYKEGAVADVDAFARELAKPDGKIKIQQHAKWGEDVGVVDDPSKLQGEIERFGLSIQEMENYGPNPGLVGQGQGVDGASGRALLAQRDSGMTELSPVFERQRDWKLRCYRKMWARIRQAWTAERFIRITDDENAVQFVPINQYQKDPMTGQIVAQNVVAQIDVDIILEEGPDTITMNEELLETFSKMGEAAMSPLGKIIIELSNTSKKEQLIKMIEDGMLQMQPGPDPAIKLEAQKAEASMMQLQAKAQQDAEKGAREIALKDKDLQLKEMEIYAKRIELQASMQQTQIQIEVEDRKQQFEEVKHSREIQRDDRKHQLELHKMDREDEFRERDAQRADVSDERKAEREKAKVEHQAKAADSKPGKATPVKIIRGKDGKAARFDKGGEVYDVLRGKDGRVEGFKPAELIAAPLDA